MAASPRDVVLVTVGGLRADTLELDHPAIEALRSRLEGAVRFEQAYAPSSLDVQSVAAVFAGRLPTRGGSVGLLEAQPASQAVTLASRLRRDGWATGLVSQAPWMSREGFTRGFDNVDIAAEGPPSPEVTDPGALATTAGSDQAPVGWSQQEVTRRALEALDSLARGSGTGSEPVIARRFVAVHYAGPLAVSERREGDSLEKLGELDRSELRSTYQLAAVDSLAELGRLIDGIEQRGGLDETMVVLAGSSGFELGEHGGAANGWTTYQESIHVPLLLLWRPGLSAASPSTAVSLVDVTPTLLQVTSAAAVAEGELDGSSLLEGFLHEGVKTAWRPAPVSGPRISELVVRERAIARAVIDGDHALVVTQRSVPPADRPVVARGIEEIQAAMLAGSHETPSLWGEASSQEFFDLSADPWQQDPIVDSSREELARLRGALRDYRRACEESAFEPLEITRRLEIDPEQLKQLESLGYL